MKNVDIKLVSTQTDGNSTDSNTGYYKGTISNQSGVLTVCYDENEDFGSKTKTEIIIESDENVVIRRTGQNSSVLVLTKGVRNTTDYPTEYGNILLRFYTKQIKNNMNIQGGELFLEYEISTEAFLVSNNTIRLSVKEMQK